jgi:peptide/nickel transport system substrate-binding protein
MAVGPFFCRAARLLLGARGNATGMDSMNRRDFITATAAATLAAPRIGAAQGTKLLKFIPQADLVVLDPIWTTATVTRNHAFLVFDTLYGHDAAFKAQPQMAAGATTEADGKIWKITLRDGLMFHDGTPVLARDCVASIKRWGKRDGFGQALLASTDDISAGDDKTIIFRLKAPFPLLLDALAKSTAAPCIIMPERLARTDAFTQVTEMVGSGPFRFKADEHMAGNLTVYEKFAGYKPRADGKPEWIAGPKIVNFDRVEWHTIPDAATAGAAITSGEMDWWEYPSPDLVPLLKRNPDVVVAINDTTGSLAIMRLNWLYPPFDNPAIRRAILGGVDQADFMTSVAGTDTSMWSTGVGVFPPGTSFASDAGLAPLIGKRDYDKVKADLKAAGYKGEKVVVMGASDLQTIKAEADIAADLLTKCGMNVDYQMMDWGTLVLRRAKKDPPDKGGWNVFCTGFGGLDFINPAVHLLLRGNGANAWFGWPDDPKMETLRKNWFDAPDLPAQQKICRDIQEQALHDVLYVPCGQYYQPNAFQKSLAASMMKAFPIFWNVKRA